MTSIMTYLNIKILLHLFGKNNCYPSGVFIDQAG